MPRFDQSSAECLVLTYKEGLLSPIAHDLMIRAGKCFIDVDVDASSVRAEIETGTLTVVTAMRSGHPHEALTDEDKRAIEATIRKDVLHTGRYPTARFTSTRISRDGEAWNVEGDLELHGTKRPVRTRAEPEGDLLVAELVLHQPDWGIKPYRAALGTLRVQEDVRVRVSVPLAEL